MAVFRIIERNENVGAIAAKSEEIARAFAQGKYGAGAEVQRVGIKQALEAGMVCEILSTKLVHTSDLNSGQVVRVVE